MPNKTANARHRADSQVSSLAALSQSVASNAGSFGRQAAVVVVAAGLAAGVGGSALAANGPQDSALGVSAAIQSSATQAVTAPAEAKVTYEQVQLSSEAKQVLQPQVAVQSTQTAAQTQTVAATQPATTPAAQKATEPAAQAAAPKEAPAAQAATGGNGAIVAAAYTGIGVPYVWGGTSRAGWDCSGFVQWAYAQAGISIPRTNQWSVMRPTSNPQPGDLVVQNGGTHVGVYVGNGMEVNALNPGQGTLLTSVAAVGTAAYYTMS